MVRMGAGGTSFDIARDQPIQTIARIRAGRSLGSKIKYTIRHPGELLRSVEDIVGRSEELSRMTQYRGTKEALKGTMSNERAAIEAARAAMENSANFYRRGEWGTVLNSAFLYLNASIQGSRAFIRSVGRDPIRTGAKVATILFAPMATMTAWNLSDPKRREAYADIAEYERENNFIIVPPNPTKDEQGRWNIIKIPLPPGVGKLTIPVRKALEQSFGVDELKFRDIANALVSSVSPIEPNVGSVVSTLTPQALKPSLEAITNQNFFTGIPQVPQSQEKLSPELQVKDYTSGTARKVGGALNASPIKVEEFIKGTFGGVGSQVLHASDRILAEFFEVIAVNIWSRATFAPTNGRLIPVIPSLARRTGAANIRPRIFSCWTFNALAAWAISGLVSYVCFTPFTNPETVLLPAAGPSSAFSPKGFPGRSL